MGVRKAHIQLPGYYFITFTNYNWLPLFELTNSYDLIYNWFDHLKKERHHIVGYVIMPNHIHLMLAYNKTARSINTLVGNGKRFMAYEIVKRLQQTAQTELLKQLAAAVNTSGIAAKIHYKVFRDSFDLQHCYSQKFILQKLTYIHDNPCVKKWMLAAHPSDYTHSSAAFYETGNTHNYPVTSWLELEANNWIKE